MMNKKHYDLLFRMLQESGIGRFRFLWFLATSIVLAGCTEPTKVAPPEISLHEAVLTDQPGIVEAHIKAGSDLNIEDPVTKNTPLIAATTFGRTEIAKKLIDAGADLNLKNSDGSTALITAAFLCRKDIALALLKSGADRQIRNKMGSTALNSVEGPWETVRPIYDFIGSLLAPAGVHLDYSHIKSTRPEIAELLKDGVINKPTKPLASDYKVQTVSPDGNERYINLDSDYIFNQASLHTFHIKLPPKALAEIDADPSAEKYVEGSLTFEGETISPVGIRYKGSVGAWAGCLSGYNWFEPSGHKVCNKLSMKIKFNWKGSDQTFYGLKKLQFHSQNKDASQMRERLGYWLFRSMGVVAPRSVHARLIINGKLSGVYALTEQIDGRFTKHHFKNGDGNLYKEVWPVDAKGELQNRTTFLEALKTNEDQDPSVELIQSFGEDLSNATQDKIVDVIEKWMDVDTIIAYAVVDRAIRHDDGPFHWYCKGDHCFNHNYYWYEDPEEAKLHLIPWDLDSTFENIAINVNPVTAIADDWGNVTADGKPFAFGPFKLPQRSAAADKLTAGWALYQKEYDNLSEKFFEGSFSVVQVNSLLDVWTEQIREATLEASHIHADAVKESDWIQAIDELRTQVSAAHQKRR